MAAAWIEKVTGSLEDKRHYREHKKRVQAMPSPYRETVEALERYSMYYGGIVKSDTLMSMLDDLADLFEQAAADGTPVSAIVGDDPVEFAETFLQNYSDGQWINKERQRLTKTIESLEREQEEPVTTSFADAPAIHVQGLKKSYKEVHVLRGVDFDVARGSIFALLGSNGAGKTTAVNILATLLRADAGDLIVNGFDVYTQDAEVRESISLTGQFSAVDEILTGRENLVLIARLRHLEDPGKIADELLERFALLDAADRKVSTYSGGMRRRLDISMSLIGSPQVIFLDEPTTGLDPHARIEVWNAVKKLAECGTTVLLTTQQLEEAEQLADRIAILHEGRILVSGTLEELKRLLPPAKVEYVEKQPTLEDVFFALVGDPGNAGTTSADE